MLDRMTGDVIREEPDVIYVERGPGFFERGVKNLFQGVWGTMLWVFLAGVLLVIVSPCFGGFDASP